jgi:hypothetical protein
MVLGVKSLNSFFTDGKQTILIQKLANKENIKQVR